MRSQLLSALLLSVPMMVACGGDDGTMITVPDAKVFMDAPPDQMAACSVTSDLGMGGPLGLGTSQMRASGDWFIMPTSGSLMGRTVFYIGAGLPGGSGGVVDGLVFQYVKPMTGNFTLNQAVPFTTSPTMAFVTAAYVLGDYNSTTKAAAQMFYASSGGMTLTMISEANGGMINGSVSATNYREINQMSGADIAGGCTTSLMGFTFALTQMAAPFAPTKLSEGTEGQLSQADFVGMVEYIERMRAQQQQQ